MPFGIPYFPPRQGEDIPTLGGSVPHGVGEIRGQYFMNYKSMFHPLQVYVSSIASLCFIHCKSMFYPLQVYASSIASLCFIHYKSMFHP